ncbi:MAG: methyl-accepting chemotaxis protein [Sideroxydans sp.]|jgi:methyl-accepting chemotaxis protein
MRTNLPVTNVEYELREGSSIVSKTDLKGLITYVNPDFLEASGFTEKELIGQPHNLVRHPDMPVEAFDDLWKTLKQNRPWTGLVKNRRKDGGYYWVVANATPIFENGSCVGYMSVRSKPNRTQIEAHEAAYRLFREGKQGALRIEEGKAVKASSLGSLLKKIGGLSERTKLNVLFGILIAALGINVFLGMAKDENGQAMFGQLQMWVAALSIVVTLVLGHMTVSYIAAALKTAREQLYRISQGFYHDLIEVKNPDESGMLLYAMKSMQIRMGFEVSNAQRIADEVTRVKIGLDNVSTNVMIADKSRNIIYMNKAISEMFRVAQEDIRKDFPNFDSNSLLGSNIDQFHKNPAHQAQALERLRGTHKATIKIGVRTFALTVNAVINDRGDHLGSAVEWIDRTAELAVEEEIAGIVAAAARGDFTQRIKLEGKTGFFLTMAQNINQLLETSAVGLDDVVRVLGALAQGNLTETITGDYQGTFGQLKDDSNATVAQLTETIGRIKEAADTINTASKEIASGNTDLSQRTEEQASSLEETAASMEQLTSTVKQNAENAKQANQLAVGASDIASKGGEVVNQVVMTMSSISDSSKKIADIISVIDGIAFQTNILALNAAVEAARAGEQGRGFAVVASEVRNLAQRSAAAAKEIKTLIEDSVSKVTAGTEQVDKAGRTMEEVVNAVKRVTDIMGEITAASAEQSQGIEQVNTAITQMDDVTQQNAALVEEAAAAAESMEEQARELAQLMSTFILAGETQARAIAAPRAPVRQLPPASKPSPVRRTSKPLPPPGRDEEDGDWKEF